MSDKALVLTVTGEHDGDRIDSFLTSSLKLDERIVSRSQTSKLIQAAKIELNDTVFKIHLFKIIVLCYELKLTNFNKYNKLTSLVPPILYRL